MKIKTNELTGAALDWAVAKCEGHSLPPFPGRGQTRGPKECWINVSPSSHETFSPSTDRDQGWSIAEREKLCVGFQHQLDNMYIRAIDPDVICWARTTAGGHLKYGPTPLVAAMRCYVASKLGDDVDVPEGLT